MKHIHDNQMCLLYKLTFLERKVDSATQNQCFYLKHMNTQLKVTFSVTKQRKHNDKQCLLYEKYKKPNEQICFCITNYENLMTTAGFL